MTPRDTEFIFRSYRIFEEKLIDVFRVIPWAPENVTAWSPELVNIFLDISSLIDSISRTLVGEGRGKDEVVSVRNTEGHQIEKQVGNLTIEDFEINLFSPLRLFDFRVVVYTYPLQLRAPYLDYRNHNGWWNAYNALKHNRVENYTRATLEKTMDALAALFLLLTQCREEEFSRALFRFEWLETGVVPEFVHAERMREPWQFWYDTELFGTHATPGHVPVDIATINPALTSPKFQKFFGRFNP